MSVDAPRIEDALKADAAMKAAQAAEPQRAVDEQHPWLGLDSFSEETRAYFFGREAEVAELCRRVQRKLLTVLFGQSGLGKTSILRAGMVPKLRPMGFCPVYVRLDYARESPPPAEQIKEAIFRATRAHGEWTQAGAAVEGESLWEFLHHRGDVLKDSGGNTVVPLLIFDQFEEIFTLGQADDAGRKRAAQFLDDLSDLVENRPPKALEARIEADDALSEKFDFARADYRILIALREDYLAHLEGVKASMPSITQNRMRLARMTGQQALAAVINPGGRLVAPEVAESIVRFIAGGSELPNAEVEPSLLSLICRELNTARIFQRRQEISVDLLAGSKETILSEFYERALADQPPAVRRFIEDEMLTDSGYRESLGEERVRKAFGAAGASPDALAKLVDRRLLRVEERLDLRRVELTHDVLCRVVAESRDLRHEREAREKAEQEMAAQKAREQATRKALVRARQVAIFCSVLAVGAVASAVFGYYNLSRARSAEANAEAARSEAEKLVGYLLDDLYQELLPTGRLAIIENLAQRALSYYHDLPPGLHSAQTEGNRALALVRLGQVQNSAGKSKEAEATLNDAFAILRGLQAKGDRSEVTVFGMARALQVKAFIAFNRADFAGSIRQNQEGAALMRPLTAAGNAPATYRRLEAVLLVNQGLAMLRAANDGSIPILQKALQIYRDIGAPTDESHTMSAGFGFCGAWLTEALLREGRLDEAAKISEEALAVVERAIVARPYDRGALRARGILKAYFASFEAVKLHMAAALAHSQAGEADDEKAYRSDPKNTGVLNNYLVRQTTVANYLFNVGRLDDSVRQARRLQEWVRNPQLYGFITGNLAGGLRQAAILEARAGNEQAAATTMSDARKMLENLASSGTDVEAYQRSRIAHAIAVARVHLIEGKDELALKLAREGVTLLEALPIPGGTLSYDTYAYVAGGVWNALAVAENRIGEHRAAEAAGRRAFEIEQKRTRLGLLGDLELHAAAIELGLAVARQGRNAEAQSIIQPAVRFFSSPEVHGSDYMEAKVLLARALTVSAISAPRERSARLAEAARVMDALPAEARRSRDYARVRAEIAREARRSS